MFPYRQAAPCADTPAAVASTLGGAAALPDEAGVDDLCLVIVVSDTCMLLIVVSGG